MAARQARRVTVSIAPWPEPRRKKTRRRGQSGGGAVWEGEARRVVRIMAAESWRDTAVMPRTM